MRSTETSELGKLSHIPVLDGFRGLAILAVIGMHDFNLPLGWIGVDIFFVISGFLITRILLNTRECEGFLSTFYMRRILRIMPIYYLTLLVMAVFWLGTFRAESGTYFLGFKAQEGGKLWWYACYLADFVWLDMEAHISSLQHLWSLAIEEQFYLVWPLVIFWLPLRKVAVICGTLLLAAYAFRAGLYRVPELDEAFSHSIFTRSDGLLAGALLAIYVQRGWRLTEQNIRWARHLFVGCLGITLVLAWQRHLSFSRHSLLMACVGLPAITLGATAALWWCMGAETTEARHRFLTWKPLAYIGKISYGFYLFHMPVYKAGRAWLGDPQTLGQQLFLGCTMSVAAFLLAAVSWHFIESPINRLKRYWNYRVPNKSAAPEDSVVAA